MKNSSIAILLMNEACRVVACSYDKDEKGIGIQPFTLFKTFRDDLAKGDIVVVPTNTRHGFTSVRVEEVNAEWSPDETKTIDWIVAKLDTRGFEEVRQKEARAIDMLNASEKRAKRKEMAAKLTEHLDESEKAALQISGSTAPATAAE